MRKTIRSGRRFAVTALGVVGLTVAMLGAASPQQIQQRFFSATINGPATVFRDVTCTWTATTDISNPSYEWSVVNGSGTTVVGTGPTLFYAFDRFYGAHQGLEVKVFNAAGDQAMDDILVGVFSAGTPECS